MIEPGSLLLNDRYDVLEVVGRGGEGTVLRAMDRRHHRLVALKRRRLPVDDGEAERFMLEARTLLSLPPYPGLPLTRDDFFEDDHHYLVLDWVEGVDLASFVSEHGRPGLPLATVLRWLAPVAQMLTHLHQSTPIIVHGDVKPANLILTTTGDIALVDFGMSSTRGGGSRGGTPGFRAPDAITASPPTRAVDVYGLAATAFGLLTGAPPHGVLPDWGIRDPERATRLEAAIRRGMATDPSRRTATPGEFVEELPRWVGCGTGGDRDPDVLVIRRGDHGSFMAGTSARGDRVAGRPRIRCRRGVGGPWRPATRRDAECRCRHGDLRAGR